MSTTLYLIQAQQLLDLALEQARQERDRGVFELARGSATCSSCSDWWSEWPWSRAFGSSSAACSAPRSSPRHRRGSGRVSTG